MLNKYLEFIIKNNPSNLWKFTRNILHWISLPFKLLTIGLLGSFNILYDTLNYKKREPVINKLTKEEKLVRLNSLMKIMPVLKNSDYELYLPRHPVGQVLDGTKHSPDHQLLRQGQYVFLMSKLNKRTSQMDNTLDRFIQGNVLARGYTWDFENKRFVFNKKSTSGDMLLGLCLGVLDAKAEGSGSGLLERFDQLICDILDNDYALREGQEPTDEPYKSIWNKLENDQSLKMKSSRAMWQPGLETVGAQTLTILAALKTNAKKNKSRYCEQEYWRLFKNGYALLSLLPTAFLPGSRGYFNDHNCINALYLLLKQSDTKVEKDVYKFALKYVFLLSKSSYNPYFTGLISEVSEDILPKGYKEKVKEYLYEQEPRVYTMDGSTGVKTRNLPVPVSHLRYSEFAYGDAQDTFNLSNTGIPVFTGLSEFAAMVLLEDEIYK